MDALRRAEENNTPASTASESTADAPSPAPDSSSLQLEPLGAESPLEYESDDAVVAAAIDEVADDTAAAADQDAVKVNDSPTQVQAQRAVDSMAGRRSSAGKQAAFIFAGFSIVGFMLAAYYLWKSDQMIAPQVPHSATLVTVPETSVVEDITEKVDAVVVEPAKQMVQANTDNHTGTSYQASATKDSVPQAAVSAGSASVAAAEKPEYIIEIHKRRTPRAVPSQLRQAYEAYQRKDYQQAEPLYRQALRRYPGNRDAMLGLAAVALHQGNRRVAHTYYTQVLKADPGDKTALLALQSLNGEHKQLEYGSRIKHWLQSDRNNAPLHFALGNQHAANGRWKEAQQAYFEAHRLRPDNADYAFNLAVSLDQLGLRQQALDYYLTAQRLAASGAAQFSNTQIDRRIAQLRMQAEQDS